MTKLYKLLNSLLFNLIKKETISVKSSHHQSIKNLGKQVIVTAKSSDNIIEAIELKDKNNFIGVQWHPEIAPQSKDMPSLFYWLAH